jgi:AraC-like DNA-binding protein
MAIDLETIQPPTGLSFRLHRWRDNLRDVEQFTADGRWSPFVGAGDHWHLHQEMELTFIERGSGLRLVGDHIARFEGPELELLGPNLPHCIQGLRHSKGLSMQFHWPLDHPLRALPEFASMAPLWERARLGLVFGPRVCQRLGPRLLAMPRLPVAGRLGLLLEVLAELAALPTSQSETLSRLTFSVREGERHQAGIERVVRHALERYTEPLALSEALRLAGMSKASFARQFPRYTGCTLTDFLNRLRLDHARRLVLGSSETISEIAYAVGFNHLSYFNRLYRRVFGLPPSADRACRTGTQPEGSYNCQDQLRRADGPGPRSPAWPSRR